MKRALLNNFKGFSLVELLIVVGIIGALASFAIPQYQVYQSKSKQKEAATLLASFYTAAQAAQAELGSYPGNFVSMGWSPGGVIHYRVSSADNGTALPPGGLEETACVVTSATCIGTIASFKKWSEETARPGFKVSAPTATATVGDAVFFVVASGIIKSDGGVDEWTIDQSKAFTNSISGL